VSKRLRDRGENVFQANQFSQTLRWVAQELAGGAQSFKDFNLNAFIVDLIKNPNDANLHSGSPNSNDLNDLAISQAKGPPKRKGCPSPLTVQKQKSRTNFCQTPLGRSRRLFEDDSDEVAIDFFSCCVVFVLKCTARLLCKCIQGAAAVDISGHPAADLESASTDEVESLSKSHLMSKDSNVATVDKLPHY